MVGRYLRPFGDVSRRKAVDGLDGLKEWRKKKKTLHTISHRAVFSDKSLKTLNRASTQSTHSLVR